MKEEEKGAKMMENVKGERRKIEKGEKHKKYRENWGKRKSLPLQPTYIKFYAETMCSVKPPMLNFVRNSAHLQV